MNDEYSIKVGAKKLYIFITLCHIINQFRNKNSNTLKKSKKIPYYINKYSDKEMTYCILQSKMIGVANSAKDGYIVKTVL